jgi:hypothetical protein
MEKPIRTYSVLTLGQTDKPSSPYVTTMTELFAQRKLKPLPFTDEEMEMYKLSETVLYQGAQKREASDPDKGWGEDGQVNPAFPSRASP